MKRLCMSIFVPLLFTLSACGGSSAFVRSSSAVPASLGPVPILQRTTADERALLATELAYKVGRTAVETAVDAGLVKGPLAARIATADREAYRLLRLARAAYDTGNGGAAALIDRARSAVGQLAGLLPARRVAS